jgi:hypothetical protein
LRLFLSILLLSVSATQALAVENPSCTEARDLVNVVKDFYQANAELTNVIQPTLSLTLTGAEGHPDPDGMRYIYGNESVDLTLSEDGKVMDIEKAANFEKDGKLCKLVNGALVEDTEEDTAQASMNFTFPFSDLDGEHSYDELSEGAKDGSKVMKSLAPGGMGFVVPGLKAFIIRPAEEDGAKPVLTFLRKGEGNEGPEVSMVGTTQLFKIKDMKKSKADTLRIEGAYTLEATFNYKPEDIAAAEARRLAVAEDAEE